MGIELAWKRAAASAAAVAAGLWLLVACDGGSGEGGEKKNVADVTQVSKEQLVGRRARERMEALIGMDWKRAYEYLSPATRKVLSYRVFANRMGVSAIVRDAATVKSVECGEDVCDVKIDLTYTYVGRVVDAMQGQQQNAIVQEKWIFSDGNWWYVWE